MWPSPDPDPDQDNAQPINVASPQDGSNPSPMTEQQQAGLTGVPPSTTVFGTAAQTGSTPSGMSSIAPINIENPSKSPKVPFIVAGVMAGIGVVALLIAAALGAAISGEFENLSVEEYTIAIGENGNLTYEDMDGLGEEGWYLLIPGDPKADTNDNGVMDACEGVNFTINNESGTDVTERVARISCSTDLDDSNSNAAEPYFDLENRIIVARMCHTIEEQMDNGEWRQEHECAEGETFTVTNDASINMSVVDLDAMYIPLIEEMVGLGIGAAGSTFAGCCSMCGGVIALVVAFIRMSSNKQQPAMQFVMQ